MPDAPCVSIVIPAFNQLAYCQACIRSLQRCTPEPHRLILVDNGSTDGVGDFFDQVPGATVLHAAENLGFAAGVNLGLGQAEGHVILLNSDTLLTPGWLTRLCTALTATARIGLAGPRTNCAPGAQQIDGLVLGDEAAVDAYAAQRAQDYAGQRRKVNRLVGFCLAIRDSALGVLGPLDERFGIGNFEDDDYGTRARRAGFELVVAEDCFVYHHGGRTFAGMGLEGEAFDALMEENRRKYEAKWQVKMPRPAPPSELARSLSKRAHAALAIGDAREAMRLFREAIACAPQCAEYYNDLGAVLWQLDQRDTAYAFFLHALERDPTHAAAYANAGEAARALGCEATWQAWCKQHHVAAPEPD